jgi:hypothetical protein
VRSLVKELKLSSSYAGHTRRNSYIMYNFHIKRPLVISDFKQMCIISGSYSKIALRDFMDTDPALP